MHRMQSSIRATYGLTTVEPRNHQGVSATHSCPTDVDSLVPGVPSPCPRGPNPVVGPVTEEPTGRLCALQLHTGRQRSVRSRSCAPSPPRQLLTDVREKGTEGGGSSTEMRRCVCARVRERRGESEVGWGLLLTAGRSSRGVFRMGGGSSNPTGSRLANPPPQVGEEIENLEMRGYIRTNDGRLRWRRAGGSYLWCHKTSMIPNSLCHRMYVLLVGLSLT